MERKCSGPSKRYAHRQHQGNRVCACPLSRLQLLMGEEKLRCDLSKPPAFLYKGTRASLNYFSTLEFTHAFVSRSRPIRRPGRLQPLAGSAGRPGHPSFDRPGLCVFGVQGAVDRGFQALYLGCESQQGYRLHLLGGDCVSGYLGGAVRGLARESRAAPRHVLRGLLLRGGLCDRGRRAAGAPVVSGLPGLWRGGRHRAGPGLHFAGVDTDQVVPRSAWPGDGARDHGLRRRRHDRQPARQPVDGAL